MKPFKLLSLIFLVMEWSTKYVSCVDIEGEIQEMMSIEEELVNEVLELSRNFDQAHEAHMARADALIEDAKQQVEESNQAYEQELEKARETAEEANNHRQNLVNEGNFDIPDLDEFEGV